MVVFMKTMESFREVVNLRISEAIKQLDALNEKQASGKVKSALFGDKRGLIKTFAVLTGENPMSAKLSDEENRHRNKLLRRDIEHKRDSEQKLSGLSKEDYFRKLHVQYIPIEGQFGNKEHSYIILNIAFVDAEYLANKFEQQSFFFGKVYQDKTQDVSYYEKKDVADDYKLIETSDRVDDASMFDDFFSKYGDIKWSFYLKYFNECYVPRNITNERYFEESFDESLTTFGRVQRRIWSHT